jgi:hypothetical protein
MLPVVAQFTAVFIEAPCRSWEPSRLAKECCCEADHGAMPLDRRVRSLEESWEDSVGLDELSRRSGGVAEMSLGLMAVILMTLGGLCPHCLMVWILTSKI